MNRRSELPSVSVVLIAYNEKDYIRQALDSVLSQKVDFTYEVLCHDDASNDGTSTIILEYARKYPGIVVPIIQKENQISKGDVNILFEYIYPKARGQYIAYIDGDDYWIDEYKLQKQYDFLETHNEYNCILHNFRFIYEIDGREEEAACGNTAYDLSIDDVVPWDSNKCPQIGCAMYRIGSAFPRPELFIKIGGGKDCIRPISDMPLYVWLVLNGKVRYIPDVMSVWRRRIRGTLGEGDSTLKHINFKKEELLFYDKLDEATGHRFEKQILEAKDRIKFGLYWISSDYKRAWHYRDKVDIGFIRKSIVFLGCFFPRIVDQLKKKRAISVERKKDLVEKKGRIRY